MLFFDDKEQVMDAQLTPFGVELLRRGEFMPSFYAFFDDDVLYNGDRGGLDSFSETQNDIETRIVDETPRMRSQRRYDNAETSIRESQDDPYSTSEFASHVLPMGKMDSFSTNSKVPLWMARLLHGTMGSSVVEEEEGIPQVEVDTVNYLIQAHGEDEEGNESKIFDETKVEFPDGSFITIIEDYLLFDIEEFAAEYGNDNFELELFEEEPSGKLIPLPFFRDPQIIKDNILLDAPIEFNEETKLTDTTLADYYFDIDIDYDIDDDILCQYSSEKNNKDNVYLSDDGMTVTDQMGKTCQSTDDGVSISNHYVIRKESDLGEGC